MYYKADSRHDQNEREETDTRQYEHRLHLSVVFACGATSVKNELSGRWCWKPVEEARPRVPPIPPRCASQRVWSAGESGGGGLGQAGEGVGLDAHPEDQGGAAGQRDARGDQVAA